MGAPMSLFTLFIGFLAVAVAVIVLVVYLLLNFITRHRRKDIATKNIVKDKSSQKQYLMISFSPEDALGQLFFLLSLCFLGIFLLAFNRDLGSPLSWRTVLLIVSVLGLVEAYYFKTLYVLTAGLIGLPVWWVAQAAVWARDQDLKTAPVFAGAMFIVLLYFLLSGWHEKKKKYKRFALLYLILSISPILCK